MGAKLKLALAVTLFTAPAAAQVEDPYEQPPQYQPPPQQYQQQPSDYPPPDPNAYQYQQQQPQYQQPPQYAQYWYMGGHPVPYDIGGGYCYNNAGHVHEYPPFDQYLFRESGGYWYFIGDPGDFGYTAQMYGYSAEHPIAVGYGGGYCYITWPHRHPYAPPSSVYFSFVGGYYRYSGPWDPYYWQWRTHYSPYYSGYYRNNYYGGRYWTVRPPPVYRVGVPGVRVAPPRMGVTVTAPGVGVHVGAPPRVYSPGVTVGPPARVYSPGVHVAPPPRVYSPPPARVYSPPAYNPAPRVYAPSPMHVAPPAAARPRVFAPAPTPVRVAPHGFRR